MISTLIQIKMFQYGAPFILKYMIQWYCTSKLIRVASQHFTICLQRHYDSEFSAIYVTRWLSKKRFNFGITLPWQYLESKSILTTFMSTCVNTTQPSPTLIFFSNYLSQTSVCCIWLKKESFLLSDVSLAARYELLGWMNSPHGSTCYTSC